MILDQTLRAFLPDSVADAAGGGPRGLGLSRAIRDKRLLSLLRWFVIALWRWAPAMCRGFCCHRPRRCEFLDPKWLSASSVLNQSLLAGLGFGLTRSRSRSDLIGRSACWRAMFEPVINAIYAIPLVAFFPFSSSGSDFSRGARRWFSHELLRRTGDRDRRRARPAPRWSMSGARSPRITNAPPDRTPGIVAVFFAALRVGRRARSTA